MKKVLLFSLLLCCFLPLRGENLFPAGNGRFGAWTASVTAKKIPVSVLKGEGFGGGDALKFNLAGDLRPRASGIRLTAGRKYRYGCYVKTADFQRQFARIVIFNRNWQKEVHTYNIPVNTKGGWYLLESTDVMPPSPDGKYTMAIHAVKVAGDGEVMISRPFIEAVRPAAELPPGTNLLADDFSDARPFGLWTPSVLAKHIPVQVLPNAGYRHSHALKTDLTAAGRIHIQGLKLIAGKKYTLGIYVKTRNFKSRNSRAVLFNQWWNKELSTRKIPADTYGSWRRLSVTGIMPPSDNGQYTFAVHAGKLKPGSELLISAPFLYEVAERKETAVRPPARGGNILPDFTADQNGEFGLWTRDLRSGGTSVRRLRGEGPGGQDAVHLNFRTALIRMSGLKLVAGEKYRFGAYVRTRGLNSAHSRIVICNKGWFNDLNTAPLPADTHGRWQKLEAVGIAPKSSDGTYSYRFYMPGFGEADVAAPFIEAMTEKGRKETYPAESSLKKFRRLYPVHPLMSCIEAEKPEMIFGYSCPLPGQPSDYRLFLRFSFGGRTVTPWRSFPVTDQLKIAANWGSPLPVGSALLQAELRRTGTGEVILANDYSCRTLPPLPPVRKKQLNNMVAELKRLPLQNGEVTFVNPRDGWIYVGAEQSADALTVTLDGKLDIIRPADDGRGLETMRHMSRGTHRLTVKNVRSTGAQLIVRTVPEIVIFPLQMHEKTDRNKFYFDRNFYRKHYYGNINSVFLSFGWNPKTALERSIGAELRDRGIRICGSHGFGAKNWQSVEKMVQNLQTDWTVQSTEGRAVDETSAAADANILYNYAEACWELTDFEKYIHVWLGTVNDMLNYPPVHAPFMAGSTNIGKGTGKLLMETYVETTPDWESLKKYYTLVHQHLKYANECMPGAAERMIMFFCGYLVNGRWNVNGCPEADVKVAFDYFMHLCATDPEGMNLYGIGCYCLNWCDEENLRWIGRLFRHYAIEGNTEMLSPKYGLKYTGDHVRNPDFKEGLKDWQAVPAEPGTMKTASHYRYGFEIEQRRGVEMTNGDTVLEITRSAKGPNRLKQTFRNFEPGKLYSLTFASSDKKAALKHIHGDFRSFLDASLEGAEILPGLSYEMNYPLPDSWPPNRIQVITRKIVFKALKPEITAVFRDWKSADEPGGKIGAVRMLNFINVKRYWPEEK